MARWREEPPRNVEDLLAAAERWWGRSPPAGAENRAEYEVWLARFHAWCEENGTNPLELLRMRRDLRMKPLHSGKNGRAP